MNRYIAQAAAIARYEFLMHWRRRPMLVISLVLLLVVGAMVLIFTLGLGEYQDVRDNYDGMTQLILFGVWAGAGVLLGLVFPVMIADTVAIDHRVNMYEMLRSYPLPVSVYLAGKAAGVWVAAAVPVVALAVISAALWWVLVGGYDVAAYLKMWLLGGLSLVALNGGLVVLLCAGQPTRYRAALVAMGLLALSFAFGFHTDSWWDYVNPVRALVLEYFFAQAGVDSMPSVSPQQFSLALAAGGVEFLLAWWGMSRWLSRAR